MPPFVRLPILLQAVVTASMELIIKKPARLLPKPCCVSRIYWKTLWCCMAIRTVLRMGDPLLLQKAAEIEAFDTPELHALIRDMEDTMVHMNGAGIAAPQIGVSLRVVIFGVGANPRYPDAEEVPYTVLITPELNPVGTEIENGWEGCLSVPGMRGIVPRYERLHYTGFDQYGKP